MDAYKSPDEDGIFPSLLQKGLPYVLTPLCLIYRACIANSYIPQVWRHTRVLFLPKPGKIDYTTAKAISLTSFLLEGLEKVIDRYLWDGPLVDLPLHLRQHAYQAGKSTESALHQLVSRLEKAIDQRQYALGVFFDIEGVFDNSSPRSVRYTLDEWKVVKPKTALSMYAWETATWLCKLAEDYHRQWLWSLIADSLLKWLSKQGVYAQGFADDGVAVVIGCFLTTLCEIMQQVLKGLSLIHISEPTRPY